MSTGTITTLDKPRVGDSTRGGRSSGGPFGPGGREPGDPGGGSFEERKYRIGMWVALFGILMLFASLTSAYIIRRAHLTTEGPQWVTIDLPRLLWVNTGLLVASSMTIEIARRALGRSGFATFKWLMLVTTMLGASFLGLQIVAWRQLVAQGVYLAASPHGSFFYVLTALHGIHLLGGVLGLAYVTIRGYRFDYGPARRTAVDVTALYWHFMDGLWVYLFLLLSFWR
ncbi:MAG TPA: cytochrome c oxidase subunit 3 [Blastocatellia bacterium]|nr:cytochrome c oxidase subunit 3 [Blastocatellia bacterium]